MAYKHFGDCKPYYDDFNADKNYNRIMFNPGLAVQARELTQIQSLLQNQIAGHADWNFKDGCPITGAKIYYNTVGHHMVISNTYVDLEGITQPTDPARYVGHIMTGQQSRQRIIIETFETVQEYDPVSKSIKNKHILFFNFLGGPIVDGEKFYAYRHTTSELVFTMLPKTEGNSFFATCDAGIIYANGAFLTVNHQMTKLGTTLDNITYNVGFKIEAMWVTPNEDASLYDLAAGYTNFGAPGADRLKYEVQLYAFSGNELPENFSAEYIAQEKRIFSRQFIPGIIIKDGKIIKEQDDPLSDSDLMDLLASRTYDESGHYTVNPWKIQLEENEDSSKYNLAIQEGLGYINGYKVKTIVPTIVEVDKPRTSILEEQIDLNTRNGFYILARYADGKIDATSLPSINEEVYIMSKSMESGMTTAQTSALIEANKLGTARIRTYHKQNGTVRIYLYNIVSADIASAKCLMSVNETGRYVNLYDVNGVAQFGGTDTTSIYEIPIEEKVKSVVPYSISYRITREFNGLECNVYTDDMGNERKYIAIHDDRLDFDNYENSVVAVFEEDTGKQITLLNYSLEDDYYAKHTARFESDLLTVRKHYTIFVSADVKVSSAQTSYRVKELNNMQEIIYLTPSGYYYNDPKEVIEYTNEHFVKLKNEDIFRVQSIMFYDSMNNGTEMKSRITLDNGQRDNLYDYGTLDLSVIIGGIKQDEKVRIEVNYQYFQHIGSAGPFVVDSYNTRDNNKLEPNIFDLVPNYQASNGYVYNIRNCLDFRPRISEINQNNIASKYARIIPRSELECSVIKYLPRYDVVYVNGNGTFGVAMGIPAENPVYPEIPSNAMAIYQVQNKSYVQSLNEVTLKFIDNRRYTMSDIAKLDKRINNLEDAVTLTQLELNALNMRITDGNGLDKYKTGLFTDNFGTFDNADYVNPEWNANIDALEQSLRANFNAKNISFSYSGDNTTGFVMHLPVETTEVYAQNTFISEKINIQKMMFYSWEGDLKLFPSVDTWVEDLGQFVVKEDYVDTPEPVTYKSWTLISNQTENKTGIDWGFGACEGYNQFAGKQLVTSYQAQVDYVSNWQKTSIYTNMEQQHEFMRQRTVEFELKGFRAGVELIADINGEPLTITGLQYVSHTDVDGNDIWEDNQNPDGTISLTIPSGSNKVKGTFDIPPKVPTGVKTVHFTDKSGLSKAEATYTGTGKSIWTTVSNTYIRNWTDVGNIKNTKITSQEWIAWDPVAESVYIDNPDGVFAESVDIYFAKKDPNMGVFIYILEMQNGYPDYENVVANSRVYLDPDEVNVPEDFDHPGLVPTNFKFDIPIFLKGQKEYAIVVATASYRYEVYTSTLSETDINQNIGIYSQPYTGSLFVSQNNRTWNAEQQSDLTFRLHVYKFSEHQHYQYKFELDASNVYEQFDITGMTLVANNVQPENTQLKLSYQIGEFAQPVDYENRITTDLSAPVNIAYNQTPVYLIADLYTTNPYLSPMIDMEQVYGIFTNNIVKEIAPNLYEAGTYISKVTNLADESNDFRIMIDAILPNNSYVEAFLRTTSYLPCYVKKSNKSILLNTPRYSTQKDTIEEVIGKTLQTYYLDARTKMLVYQNASDVQVAGYDTDGNDTIIYLNQIGNPDVFYNENENGAGYDKLAQQYTDIILMELPINMDVPLNEWSEDISYSMGEFVLYDNQIWKASIDANLNNIPTLTSITWEWIPSLRIGSVVLQQDQTEWRPMELVNDVNGSAKMQKFNEYTYKPKQIIATPFTSFSVKLQCYSINKVDIPRIKNLRCVATV